MVFLFAGNHIFYQMFLWFLNTKILKLLLNRQMAHISLSLYNRDDPPSWRLSLGSVSFDKNNWPYRREEGHFMLKNRFHFQWLMWLIIIIIYEYSFYLISLKFNQEIQRTHRRGLWYELLLVLVWTIFLPTYLSYKGRPMLEEIKCATTTESRRGMHQKNVNHLSRSCHGKDALPRLTAKKIIIQKFSSSQVRFSI